MKKKVAIVIPSLRGGGAERVMVNILRNLDQNKFDLRLIVIKKEGPNIDLLPKNLNVVDLNSTRVRYSLIKLIKALNEFKPDIIVSTLGHLNLALIIIKTFLIGSPKIFVREASTPSMSLLNMNKGRRYIFSFLYKKLYPKADLIIAQCEEMKKDLVNTFELNTANIKYIYNPLDLEKIKLDREKGNPYNNKKINIVAVGRLTYVKGFDILINAFNIVNDKISNTHLTILGDGELKEELENQVKLLNNKNISFVGFTSNPYPYFFYSDTYVLSSRWEGFPNTLLEALACDAKVVAADCKSGPMEILKNGKYGTLVPPGDHVMLAEGILLSINSENKSNNRGKDFDVKTIIKEYEELLMGTSS